MVCCGYCYCGAIGVQYTRGGKSGGEQVTLFGGYSYDGVSAAIGVQHTEVANLGVVSDAFWRLLL